MKEMKVTLKLTHQSFWRFQCPECDEECPTHDHRQRQWRHLDTCGYVTLIEAGVPRVDCPEHGVRQAHVPWAEPGGRFTSLFEALTISWLKVATIKSVSEQMRISWDEASGIPQELWERAVKRGLAKRESRPIEDLAIDETSFQKRHEYVTVVTDRNSGTIIEVLDDRKKATLKGWLEQNRGQLQAVRSVSMDR